MRKAIVELPGLCMLVLAAGAAAPAHAQADAYQPQIPAAEVRQLEQARTLRLQKKPKDAIPLLEQLVGRQPDYFNAQYELGLAYSDVIDDIPRSIPPLERAAALKRTHPEITDAHVFNSLGWAYMYTGRSAQAEAAFKEAEAHADQLTPEVRRKLYNNLGYLYLNTGNPAAAEKYLHVAAEQYDSAQARHNLKTLEAVNRQARAPKQ